MTADKKGRIDSNHSSTKFSASPDTFQHDTVGIFTYNSFPTGWYDAAQVSPESGSPQPSAVVIETNDAFGHPTKAVAALPAVADSQGIYRPIEASNFYKTQADVRVDQFSDVDPSIIVEDPDNPGFLLCGRPVGTENIVDWPMQISFANLDGSADPSIAPTVGLIASAETHRWRLLAATTNIVADVDLDVQIQEDKWYNTETDFDATKGILHGVITDISSGTILSDKMVFLQDPKYGNYDPAVDGVFNAELYIDGEHSVLRSTDPSLTQPGLALIDNIDSSHHDFGYAYGQGHDHGSNLWDGILCDHG